MLPPLTETLFASWVAIVPKPKLVLAVEAAPKSDKLFDAVSLASNWVCIADDTPFR